MLILAIAMKTVEAEAIKVGALPINMGDATDFERIYLLYHAPLVKYCAGLTGTDEACADIVSDLFLSIWRKQVKFKSADHAKYSLYHSAKNACMNFIRHRKIAAEKEAEVSYKTTEFSENPFHILIRTEAWAEIYRAIQELPLQNRRVVTMSYLEGLSNQEIAAEMGLPMSTIRTYKLRGLGMLKNKMPGNLFILLLALLMFR